MVFQLMPKFLIPVVGTQDRDIDLVSGDFSDMPVQQHQVDAAAVAVILPVEVGGIGQGVVAGRSFQTDTYSYRRQSRFR